MTEDDEVEVLWAAEVARLRAEVERLTARQQELLLVIRRLSAEVPYADEAGKVGPLLAEIGTLRAALAERDEFVRSAPCARCNGSGADPEANF